MPALVGDLIDYAMEIIDAKPTYEKGCSNKKKCDCIGMIKYAFRQCGITLSSTGTNDMFRRLSTNIRSISSVSNLKPGDFVFKCKKPGTSGYDLPDKYKPGGSGYNGDLNDYSHVGMVKQVSPLRIIHMTSPTAKTDTAIGNWKYATELPEKYVEYIGSLPEIPELPEIPSNPPTETVADGTVAIVTANNSSPVKMRAEASVTCNYYDLVPQGAKVTVLKSDGVWSQISYGKRKGWFMMTKFLKNA